MRELLKVDLKLVRLSKSRPTDPRSVNAIAESMRASGLINPIIVKRGPVYDGAIMVDGYSVVAGNHRVSAARALGWTEIDAFVHEGDDLHAELLEIDENLQRAELTAAQRAAAIKRRKEIWGALHPELSAESAGKGRGPGRPVSFATDTSERTGEKQRTVREHLSRAEALGDDINDVVGTSLDKGVELDALKSMPEPERKELIQRAKAGEKVSARELKAVPASQPKAAKKAAGPDGAGLAYMSGQAVRDLVALVDRVVDQAMALRDHSVQQVAEAADKSVPDELRPYFAALAGAEGR